MSASIGPNDVCRSVTMNGESKLRAVTTTALVPGVLLLSTLLATSGVARARRGLIFVAAGLMLAETPVVFTIAPLTLITGLLYLIFASRSRGYGPCGVERGQAALSTTCTSKGWQSSG